MTGPLGTPVPILPSNAWELREMPNPIDVVEFTTADVREGSAAIPFEATYPQLLVPYFFEGIQSQVDRLHVWYSPREAFSPAGSPPKAMYGIPARRGRMLLTPGRWYILPYCEQGLAAAAIPWKWLRFDARIPGVLDRFWSDDQQSPTTMETRLDVGVGATPVRMLGVRETVDATYVRVEGRDGERANIRWGQQPVNPPGAAGITVLGLGEYLEFSGPSLPLESLWAVRINNNAVLRLTVGRLGGIP